MPMRLKLNAAIVSTLLLVSSASIFASPCEESKIIKKTFPAEGLTEFNLNVLAGYLEVDGGDSKNVEFYAKVCTDEVKYLDKMRLDIDQVEQTLTLTTIIPYHNNDWHADYAYMNVEVKLPKTLLTRIRDSSGDLDVSHVRLAQVDDSSGQLSLSNITGPLVIVDSSGGIRVDRLQGDLNVSDSSGEIRLRDIQGDIVMPYDSSGDIEIEEVSGGVIIHSDSSGDIDIESVGGDVHILSDSSGGIKISKIKGSARIDSDSSGEIRVSDIEGDFEVGIKGSGQIRTDNVEGQILLPNYRQ